MQRYYQHEEFWAEVENVLALTKPLCLMVKYSDGECPKMGEVYERMTVYWER